MNAETFYVIRNDKTEGPLSRHDLKCYLGGNAITPDSLCSREGDAKWIPVKEMLNQTTPQVSGLAIVGTLLILAGVGCLVYFFAIFETSVAVPDGHLIGLSRVENMGLLNTRQNGVIIGSVVLVIGVVVALVSRVVNSKTN